MILCGIDYSITSPCMALTSAESYAGWMGSGFSFENIAIVIRNEFLYRHEKEIKKLPFLNVDVFSVDNNINNIEKYDKLSDHFINLLTKNNLYKVVLLEGYSYGSKAGMTFNIGENTALLKDKIFKNKIPYSVIPPTVVKKFATGKGNANKDAMYDAFVEKWDYDLSEITGLKRKHLYDIIDAVWILFMLYTIIVYECNNEKDKKYFDFVREHEIEGIPIYRMPFIGFHI